MFEDLPFKVTIKYKGEWVPFDSLPQELQDRARENARKIIADAIMQQLRLWEERGRR